MSGDSSDENSSCPTKVPVPDPTGAYGYVLRDQPGDVVGQAELELRRAQLKLAKDALWQVTHDKRMKLAVERARVALKAIEALEG